MSGETVSARLSETERSQLKKYADDESIAESKALERATVEGLRSIGYAPNGGTPVLNWNYTWEMAKLSFVVSLTLILVYSRVGGIFDEYALFFLFVSVTMLILERFGPRVLEWYDNRQHTDADVTGG